MNSKNKVIENYVLNLCYQILVVVLPLVITPYLTRTLSIDGIGKYSSVYGISNLFYFCGMLGVLNYGSRQIAKHQKDKKERSNQFWSIWLIQFLAGGTFSIIFFIFFVKYHVAGNGFFYLLMLPLVVGGIFDISWFYIGMEDMKKTVMRNVFMKGLTVLFIFILVKNENDLNKYFLIQSVSFTLSLIVLWLNIPRFVNIQGVNINVSEHYGQILLLFVPIFFSQLYTCFDRFVIAFLSDEIVSGYYDLTLKMVKIINPCLTVLGTALLPRITNLYSNNEFEKIDSYIKKSFDFTVFCSFLFMGGLMVSANGFVQVFFGNSYEVLIDYVIVSAPLVLFIPVGSIFATQVALPLNKNGVYIVPIVVTAIVDFVFLFILVPHLNLFGAIVSVLVAEFICMLFRIVMVRNVIDIKLIFMDIYKPVVSFVASLAIVLVVKSIFFSNHNILMLFLISGFLYTFLYLLFSFVLKSEFIILIVDIVKGIIRKYSSAF